MRNKRIPWTFSGEEADALRDQLEESSTTRAIQVGDLNVVFQPIVDLKTGRMVAAEALVRCRWAAYTNPEVLIREAAKEGSMGRLGRMIRDVAFQRCRDVPLFVNIHPAELMSRWLVRPDDPINFHGADVYLEITESAAFEYFALCRSVLKEVCSRTGAKLVIDDLGAGYSNLKRVVDLRPDVIKLDRALVKGLDQNPRQQVLFRHVVNICLQLDATVVAEGVETEGELRAVQKAKATFGQGYLFAKPAYPLPDVFWPDED